MIDPLVNTAAVDAFFQNADSAGFEQGDPAPEGSLAGDFGNTDFFDPLGGNAPADTAQTPAEPAPSVPPVDFAAENATLKQQLAELQLYKPLGELIQRNPNFLQGVEAALKTPSAPVVPAEPVIERPVAPVKPANYDYAEAAVPGTESFKYHEALAQYPMQMMEYIDKRDAAREAAITKQQQAFQQAQAQQQAQTQLQNELATKFGYKPEQVQEFIQVMSDPASRSLENLVALHQLHAHRKAQNPAAAAKAAQKNVPLPVGIVGGNGGGGQATQLTDSDAFNVGLMAARRK